MADWNVCAGCNEEMPDLLQDSDGKWWCYMPCRPDPKGPDLKEFDVVVHINEPESGCNLSRTIRIWTEYDLTLGDEKACEIVEDKCEELGLLTNNEDYMGGEVPRELDGFDVLEPPHGHVATQVMIQDCD